jgi:hypothetical protein
MHKNKLESGVHLPNKDPQLKMIFVTTLFYGPQYAYAPIMVMQVSKITKIIIHV